MALCPIIARARLSKHKVIGSEELTERTGAHRVHRARLEIEQNGARDIASARRLVVIDVDALELKVRVAVVRSRRVDAVLIADHLPELGADLIAALSRLNVADLAHGDGE